MDSKRYVYSDLGFILLQQVVESIVKLPMDLYLAKEFYAPMGLQRTMYLPLQKYLQRRDNAYGCKRLPASSGLVWLYA